MDASLPRHVVSIPEKPDEHFCFGWRRIAGHLSTIGSKRLIDLRICTGKERILDCLDDGDLKERLRQIEQRFAAYIRSAKAAHIDIADHFPDLIVPREVRDERWDLQSQAISTIARTPGVDRDYIKRYDFIRALMDVELTRIRVDTALFEDGCQCPDPIERKFFQSLRELEADGFVRAYYSPVGGKTGRVRVEGGFPAMSIPKRGRCRDAIISRFDGGRIYSYDFNAVDYRCIVKTVGGELAEKYRGAQDFHLRTLSFLMDPSNDAELRRIQRESLKFISYVYIYGGQEESLVAKTGLSLPIIRGILKRLDEHIEPIKMLRQRLWTQAREMGYVELPNGDRVSVPPDAHEGKVMGLYAQSFSSRVFEEALTRVHGLLGGLKSRIILPVHDELVIDMHPDDMANGTPLAVKREMQGRLDDQAEFVVKLKSGSSYGKQDQ